MMCSHVASSVLNLDGEERAVAASRAGYNDGSTANWLIIICNNFGTYSL